MGARKVMLDLRRVNLYGWEAVKNREVIAYFIAKIRKGAELPLVIVARRAGGAYELATFDGGHNRAYAHFVAGIPLPCIVRSQEKGSTRNMVNIRDIQLVPDDLAPKWDKWEYRRQDYPA